MMLRFPRKPDRAGATYAVCEWLYRQRDPERYWLPSDVHDHLMDDFPDTPESATAIRSALENLRKSGIAQRAKFRGWTVYRMTDAAREQYDAPPVPVD